MKKNLFFGFAILLILAISLGNQGSVGSEDELKAKANELFEAENYKEAKLMYAQLLSLYPKDPTYNYRFGACVLQTEADKTKPMKYLSFAASKANVDPLAYFYLGRAYHLNYDFVKAVKLYSKFKNKASSDQREKYSVDRQIEMCKNGRNLLTKLNEVQVLERQSIAEKDFYRIYDENAIGGKILAVPEQFKSKYDKKINDKSVVFLPSNAKQVYYSSYGKKGENGKDLYKAIKLGNGEWSEGVSLGNSINTPYDEDYAYIKPDGRTLYFASKGHTSMGGYDIFRSVLDNTTGQWSEPENLDFAFNSADDDFMFVTDQEEVSAYFASNRVNEFGEVTVYNVLIERAPAELSVISGTFIAESNTGERKATITVIDKATQETVGVYETDEKGNYSIEIAKNGGEYQFNVETNEVDPIHTGVVIIPEQDEFEVLGQELRLVGLGNEQQLVIKNIFDGTASANLAASSGPRISSSLIKLKADLEVNYNSDNLAALQSNAKANENDDGQTKVDGSASNGESVASAVDKENTSIANDSKNQSANTNLSATSIKEELTAFKAEAIKTIDSKQKAIGFQYANAIELEQEATALFNEAAVMEEKGSQAEAVESKRKAAAEKALKASFAAQLAQGLEASINNDLSNIESVETAELEIDKALGENDLQAASKVLTELKSKDSESLEDIVATSFNDIAKRNSLEQKKINDFSSKAASFSEEKSDLENQLSILQKKEQNAKGNEKEELVKSIENIELDLKDLEYQSGILNKNLIASKLAIQSLAAEKAQLQASSGSISSTNGDLVQVSEEEKNELFNQLKKYRDEDKLAFDPENKIYASLDANSIKQGTGTNEIATNSPVEGNSSNQQEQTNESNIEQQSVKGNQQEQANGNNNEELAAIGNKSFKNQTLTSINSNYLEEISAAEAVADDELKLSTKIEVYDNWLSDLEGKKKEVNDVYEAEIDEKDRSVLKIELDQLSESINEQQKSKKAAELELTKRQSGQFVADSTPITKASDITARSIVKDDFTNLKFDQKVQPSSTQSGLQLIEAKKALYEAGELAKQEKMAQESAYTLPTPAERTKAFADANRLKKESEAKQIEAANKFAEFNLKEYKLNKAKIYEASDIDEKYVTESRDIAELLADEADNFYSDATALRAEVNNLDRLSQKEVNLQKAYDYELLAIKKQQETLKKLGMVVSDALIATETEESTKNAEPFIQVIEDEEILAIVEAPKAKAAAEQRTAQVITLEENIAKQGSVADEMEEGAERDSVMALIEDLGQEREQLVREAALYYERERQIKKGLVGVQASNQPATAQVLAPGNSTFEVLLDTVDIDGDREELIMSSEAFKAFAKNRQELVIQSKAAEVAYQEALALASENSRLQKQAVLELNKSKVVNDEEEKQRLIKSAQVIQNTIKQNEEKIETINLQIKVKNFLFQSLLDKDNAYLSKLRERERKEYVFLSADYVPEIESESAIANLPQSLPTVEGNTGSLESDETAEQTNDLKPIKATDAAEATDFIDGNVANELVDVTEDKTATQTAETGAEGETTERVETKPVQVETADNAPPKVKQVNTVPKNNTLALVSNEESTVEIDNIDIVPRQVKQAIFVTLNRNESAYSENKPIPTKTTLPEGIVYKVQIGAFRKEIPSNTFKGFAPLMAEPTGTGITRYTAGLFANLNNATAARDEIRKVGYPDAFVVAFLNGERISISKARAESGSTPTSPTVTNFPKVSSGSSNTAANRRGTVATAEQVTQVPGGSKEALPNEFTSDNIEEVINAKTVEGLYYTIQVGVFSAPVKKGVFNYEGLNVVALESGLYRYNAGMFNSALQAADLKNTITATIKDAFVTAYYNGKRISLTEASKLKNQ